MKRGKRCPQGTCTWVLVRGSTIKQRCSTCRDPFPCTKACLHYECIEARVALATLADLSQPQEAT